MCVNLIFSKPLCYLLLSLLEKRSYFFFFIFQSNTVSASILLTQFLSNRQLQITGLTEAPKMTMSTQQSWHEVFYTKVVFFYKL